MKKIYITLALLLPLFLVGCSIDSLIPQDSNNTNSATISTGEIAEKTAEETTEELTTNIIKTIKTRSYENKAEKFSFEFLSGRTFQENKYGFNTIVFTPQDDEIKENVGISVQHLQKHLSIQKYYEETIKKLKESIIGFEEISSKDIIQDGLNGKSLTYKYKEGDILLKTQENIFISDNDTVYVINYTATDKTFDNFIEGVNIIIRSFKIID